MELICETVEVHELSLEELWDLESEYELKNYVSPDEPHPRAGDVMNEIRNYSPHRVFRLFWKGSSRVPKGVSVGGYTIQRTQNGVVTFSDHDYFGTYDRLLDRGGEDGNEHLMLVYLDPATF